MRGVAAYAACASSTTPQVSASGAPYSITCGIGEKNPSSQEVSGGRRRGPSVAAGVPPEAVSAGPQRAAAQFRPGETRLEPPTRQSTGCASCRAGGGGCPRSRPAARAGRPAHGSRSGRRDPGRGSRRQPAGAVAAPVLHPRGSSMIRQWWTPASTTGGTQPGSAPVISRPSPTCGDPDHTAHTGQPASPAGTNRGTAERRGPPLSHPWRDPYCSLGTGSDDRTPGSPRRGPRPPRSPTARVDAPTDGVGRDRRPAPGTADRAAR
jgi:hypothetical protein